MSQAQTKGEWQKSHKGPLITIPIPFLFRWAASPAAWNSGSLASFHAANCSQVIPSCWSSHCKQMIVVYKLAQEKWVRQWPKRLHGKIRLLPIGVLGLVNSNNQWLRSAGDKGRRSRCFCSDAVLRVGFTWQMVKTHVMRLRGVEGWNGRDKIASCALHSFLVEVQTNAGYIHATHA